MLEPNITRGQIAIDPRNGVLFYKDGSGNLMKTTLSFNQDTYTNVSTDDTVTFSNNVVIDGNLTVNGDTVTVNVSQLSIEDNILILNSNVTGTPTQNAGIEIERGNLPNVSIRWNEPSEQWEYTNDGTTYAAIGSGGGGGGSTAYINDIGDVVTTTAVNGEYLKYDGTYWRNATITLGTNTSGNYVQSLVAGTGVTLSNNSGEGSQPTIAIGQDVSTGATPTFGRVIAPLTGNVSGNLTGNVTGNVTGNLTGNVTGNLTGNITGDVTGTVSSISNHGINDLSDVTISGQANGDFLRYQNGSWINDAVNLSTDTVGNYVQNLVAGTGVSITNNTGEGSTPTVAIGQSVGTSDTVTFNVVNADLTGDVTGTVSDISNHGINDLSDVVISGQTNGDFLRYQSGSWINDAVNLSTDTIGDYVAKLAAGTGITITNNSGEGATPNIAFSGSIDSVSDVVITSAHDGETLIYNGTNWVNSSYPTGEPTGHEDKTQSVISFDEGNRRFSIGPASTSFVIWNQGKRYVKTTTETIDIPDTSATYYIYYNSSGQLSYKTSFFDLESEAPVAYVYWNEVDNKCYFFADERHGITMDWATHEYLHRTRGAAIASGFGANGYTLVGDGTNNNDIQIDIANGTFFDEDLEVAITNSATPTANTWQQRLQDGGAYIPVMYRTNNHWFKDVATAYPLKKGTNRPTYNLNTAGTWSTPEIANNRWGISWIIATNNLNEPIICILGQEEYSSTNNAEEAIWEDLNLDGFPIVEFRPLYKIIYFTSNSYSNFAKAKFTHVTDLRRVISSGSGVPSVPVSDHGNMTGLSDDDHTQYLTEERHNSLDHSSAMSSVVLDDISNIAAPSPSSGDFLKYNGTDWVNDPINLGTDTTGSYIQSLVAGTGVTVSNNSGEGATPTISIGQDVSTGATPSFSRVFADLTGDVTGTVSDISNHSINDLNDVVTVLSYEIGDTGPAGGIIFITPSTVGNTTGKYFEAAPASSEVSRTWASSSNGNTFVSGADGVLLDTGKQNTFDIAAQSGNTSENSAAVYASQYSLNGYSDWFLPSLGELIKLYENRLLVGGFEEAVYWSSSEGEDANAAYIHYSFNLGGETGAYNKLNSPVHVRPIRSFMAAAINGEFFKYNGTSWVNSSIDLGTDTTGNYVKSLVSGTGISISNNSGEGATPSIALNASLNDLTDATMTGATPNQVLAYNGTAWTNTTVGDYWNKVNGNNNASYGPSVLISANSNSYNNVGIGEGVLPLLTEGDSNIAIGVNALNKVVDSDENIAIGKSALANATGNYNIAIGGGALFSYNNLWAGSVAIGHQSALYTTGLGTTSVGYSTLRSNTTGEYHCAFGYASLYSNTTGTSNVAFGAISSEFNTTGSYNTAIGTGALRNNISGSYNVAIGYYAGIDETGSNKLYIANSSTSNPLIYGDFSTSLLRVNGSLEVTSSLSLTGSNGIIFEGATPNTHETTLNVVEPTEDRTILLPNASGTLSLEDNTAWTSYTPTITADGGGFALNNGTLTGRYKQVGKTVFFKLKFVFGSTTTAGSGHWNFSLPVTAYDSDFTFSASILDDGVAWHGGIGNGNYTGSTSNFVVITTSPSASITTWVPVGNGGPFTWGTADNITVSGSYEAA
jgi:hypothetical protein